MLIVRASTVSLALLLQLGSSAIFAQTPPAVFSAHGERLDLAPPTGWKLVDMAGNPDGVYAVRYASASTAPPGVRAGVLTIERVPYPDQAVLERMAQKQTNPAAVLGWNASQKLEQECGPGFARLRMRRAKFAEWSTVLSGGFCGDARGEATYGAGAVVAIFEGKQYLYRVHYVWRASSASERDEALKNVEDHIDPPFVQSLASAKLCDEAARSCSVPYQP